MILFNKININFDNKQIILKKNIHQKCWEFHVNAFYRR